MTLAIKEAGRRQAKIPRGVGPLTFEVLRREIGDWSRFNNRREVSSYTGLCPREHSSGGKRRAGSINKSGNPRVRAMLVEMVTAPSRPACAITAASARWSRYRVPGRRPGRGLRSTPARPS